MVVGCGGGCVLVVVMGWIIAKLFKPSHLLI